MESKLTEMRVLIALLFISLSFPSLALADGPLIEFRDEIEPYYCISENEFSISGVSPGQKKEVVIKKLGKPSLVKKGLVVSIYHFTDMMIDFCYERVGIIRTTASHNKTPSGIHPGLHRHDLFTIIGLEQQTKNPESEKILKKHFDENDLTLSFPCCTDLIKSMQFKFDGSGYVTQISIGYDCP